VVLFEQEMKINMLGKAGEQIAIVGFVAQEIGLAILVAQPEFEGAFINCDDVQVAIGQIAKISGAGAGHARKNEGNWGNPIRHHSGLQRTGEGERDR
jgi:hypothetical protein